MTAFPTPTGTRGNAVAKQRRELLEDAARLGVVEYFTNMAGEGRRKFTQYVVRVAGGAVPWRVLDGREVGPWLLGIAEARAAADDYTGPALLKLLAPFMDGADEAPAELAAGMPMAAERSADA